MCLNMSEPRSEWSESQASDTVRVGSVLLHPGGVWRDRDGLLLPLVEKKPSGSQCEKLKHCQLYFSRNANDEPLSFDRKWSQAGIDDYLRELAPSVFEYLDNKYGERRGPKPNNFHWYLLGAERSKLYVLDRDIITGVDLDEVKGSSGRGYQGYGVRVVFRHAIATETYTEWTKTARDPSAIDHRSNDDNNPSEPDSIMSASEFDALQRDGSRSEPASPSYTRKGKKRQAADTSGFDSDAHEGIRSPSVILVTSDSDAEESEGMGKPVATVAAKQKEMSPGKGPLFLDGISSDDDFDVDLETYLWRSDDRLSSPGSAHAPSPALFAAATDTDNAAIPSGVTDNSVSAGLTLLPQAGSLGQSSHVVGEKAEALAGPSRIRYGTSPPWGKQYLPKGLRSPGKPKQNPWALRSESASK
ncbi:hypothetical protein BN946_scf184876.g23 [Trametes cinnabarina]|uniref:Uncharacterized protein n=1 Tax=Pycnoporus cinnabarinus TaxID=5643 RepID=A0A060SP17_PYCCI|nr:hypothetical protein BN946_scf184876.g23 [Trametes cinnabarina]